MANKVSTVFGSAEAKRLIMEAIDSEIKRTLGAANEEIGLYYINKKDTAQLYEETNKLKVGRFIKDGVINTATTQGLCFTEQSTYALLDLLMN